ncbi:unnamed protein product [Urochloa humidicola]
MARGAASRRYIYIYTPGLCLRRNKPLLLPPPPGTPHRRSAATAGSHRPTNQTPRSVSTAAATGTTTNNPGLAAGRRPAGGVPCTAHREDDDNAPADDAAADDQVLCSCCSELRALLHCAHHGARLCLPCDVRVHAAAASPAHRRAPLCDACHDAPAAALCADHGASLCAPCARAAGCAADRHATRPARAFTGIPDAAELARILSGADTTPPAAAALSDPDTWVPDLVNIELLPDLPSTSSWRDGSLIETGGNFEGRQMAAGSAAALPIGDGEELFIQQQDWPNLDNDDAGLDHFNFIAQDYSNLTNSFNLMGHTHTEGAFEASSSLGYDHPLIASCSEPIIASTDAVLESMAGNNAAYHQFCSVATANTSSNVVGSSSELLPQANTFYASSTPMLPRDEFPGRHFSFEVKPPCPAAVSSPTMTGVYQDQEAALQAPEQASSQDIEARTKQLEKRQEAKQRYKDKKKNRRFGKQIMYVSRKVRADTRNRVKGRFAKAPSGSGHGDEQAEHQCGDDDQPTNS